MEDTVLYLKCAVYNVKEKTTIWHFEDKNKNVSLVNHKDIKLKVLSETWKDCIPKYVTKLELDSILINERV